MSVQAFGPKLAVERFDEAVIRGLAGSGEVEGDRIGIGPKIEVPRDEFAAVVDPYRPGITDPTADAFQRLDKVLAAIGEPCIGRGAEAGMRVDDGEDTGLVAKRQLVVNKKFIAQTSFGPTASWQSSRSLACTRRFGRLFRS